MNSGKLFTRFIGPLPKRIVVDSDNHYPVHDPRFEDFKLRLASDFAPDLWVNLGDQYDCYSLSDFPKDPRRKFGGRYTLQQEFDSARHYWRCVREIADRVIYLPGNHEERIARHIAAHPGLHGLKSLEVKTAAQLPDKVVVYPYDTLLLIGDLLVEHGDRAPGGIYSAASYLRSPRGLATAICGHLHRPQVAHSKRYDRGRPRVCSSYYLGHGSDVSKQHYAVAPDWCHGFALVEMAGPTPTVYPIVPTRGRITYNGRSYAY